MSTIAVIGSGFSGLSAAAYLSAAGHEVHVYEKNSTAGGRARQFRTEKGFVFDMGPSWYWMPDVFERFFADFGRNVAEFYDLKLLDPSFDMVFGQKDVLHIPGNFAELCSLFDSLEKGSGFRLQSFLREAQFKYELAMTKMVYMPGLSIREFADRDVLKGITRLQVFTSLAKHVRKHFSHPKLLALMEFPVLFLGAMPADTPAMYSLMNYAGLKLGNWYPAGGFGKVVTAIQQLAEGYGASFHFNAQVDKIVVKEGNASGVLVNGTFIPFDAVLASADYHHVENDLLAASERNYSSAYWDKRTLAPSSLIFYIGLRKRIGSLQHHTLFFDENLTAHSEEIYKDPKWPTRPLFYVCCPSQSDRTLAPAGHENLFLLMPIAPGLADNEDLREKYFSIMMRRLETHVGEDLVSFIVFKKSYCVNDFVVDYHSYKGNAYGLANTLKQTALLKPKMRNKRIRNLFYAGQLTVPGPGVPPSLVSGKVAAEQLLKELKNKRYEAAL